MWFVSIAEVLVLAVSTVGATDQPPVSPGTLPEPIATRQTLFSIPFEVDQTEQLGKEPLEVQLFVSTDRGISWHLYSKVEPQREQFLFRAGGDGEFWFLIRTLDRTGQLHPKGTNDPGLRVIVDTTPPKLQLEAASGEAGQITATWQVSEPNLDADSLKIQYRTAADRPWQSVAIDHEAIDAAGPIRKGRVTWWPQAGPARVEIRAEAADTAGNPAVTHAQVNVDHGPIAGSRLDSQPHQARRADIPLVAEHLGYGWRASADSAGRGLSQFSPSANGTVPFTAASDTGLPRSDSDGSMALPPESSVAVQVNSAFGNQYLSPPPTSTRNNDIPSDVHPQVVNTRVFEVDYDVESVGPSGIARVELWGTKDGGLTWSSFGVDDDRQSPLLVTVNEEGTYGFTVAAESGVGLGGEKPKRGDTPQIWIGVDQTKPRAQIISTEPGVGSRAGQLIICWEAEDEMLGDRPVSLLFSQTAGGPWLAIASGLENTGEYAWSGDSRAGDRVYLRLEVRDEAGNLGIVETLGAVSLENSPPVTRIRDVRPSGHSARTPRNQYYPR